MNKYFLLQSKRLSHHLLGALLATLILLGGLLLIFQTLVRQEADQADQKPIKIGMVGQTDDPFLQVGLTALSGFDSFRFTLELQQMELADAQKGLSQGALAAYVVVPEGFLDEAMYGHILPLEFVSTTGATGLVSIFKEELTQVISQVLLSAQKGVYGMEALVSDNGLRVQDNMSVMAVKYGEYVFARDKIYTLEELGIGDALGLEGYLLCGLSVLFLLLCCLPYAPLMIRKDVSLSCLLRAKGFSALRQALAELCAYFITVLSMVLVLLLGAKVVAGEDFPFFGAFLRVIPVVLMAVSMSYMLCCLSTDLTGGIVLQFFSILALCFVSGCLYPVYVFPVKVQQVAAYLPTGLARSLLAGCITGQKAQLLPLWLLGYTGVFFLVAVAVNARRIKGVGK